MAAPKGHAQAAGIAQLMRGTPTAGHMADHHGPKPRGGHATAPMRPLKKVGEKHLPGWSWAPDARQQAREASD